MKRIIVNVLCVAFIVGFCFMAFLSSLYPLTTKVIELDMTNDIVVVEDSNGFTWEFIGCEDWSIDDCCTLLMWSHFTPSIYNDVIISTRYDSWTLE